MGRLAWGKWLLGEQDREVRAEFPGWKQLRPRSMRRTCPFSIVPPPGPSKCAKSDRSAPVVLPDLFADAVSAAIIESMQQLGQDRDLFITPANSAGAARTAAAASAA